MAQATPRDPRRLAFYLDQLEVGGVERIAVNVMTGLRAAGWSPMLVLNRKTGALLREVPADVPVHDLGVAGFAQGVRALSDFLVAERPAVLISQRAYLNTLATLANLMSGRVSRLVLAEHTLLHHEWYDSRIPKRPADHLIRHVLPHLYRLADAAVGVSVGVATDLERFFGIPRSRVQVLYNPIVPDDVATRAAQPITPPWPDDGRPLLVAVGRFTVDKGYDLLLRALPQVLERMEARLAFVGDGPEAERLRRLTAELGLQEHVWFLGYQSNPYAWLARADVFVMPSLVETFPTVIVEAMAVRCPVVSFDCPQGPREIITHEVDGLLIPPEDTRALASGICRVIEDKALANRLRHGGALRAQDFTFPRTIGAYERLFESLTLPPTLEVNPA